MKDRALRRHLDELLKGDHAHIGFERLIADWPAELRAARAAGVPYTAWQLLEHLRIAQWDILEFSRDPEHVSPKWPEGYWPAESAADLDEWDESVEAFRRDHQALRQMVADPATDLLAPFPWGSGQSLLREVLLVADHNAYHFGQLVILRRLLGIWPST